MKFRPRFTVRTLATFVTLVCAYFGAWEATKRYGLTREQSVVVKQKDGTRSTLYWNQNESAPMPFLIRRDVANAQILGVAPTSLPTARYYLWLFGLKFKVYGDPKWKELEELQNP